MRRAGRTSRSRRRLIRWTRVRRWSLPGLAAVALAAAMTAVVKRDGEVRRLSGELESLRRTEQVARDELAAVVQRADSLSSRGRIEVAAPGLGLRPAEDDEIVWLEEEPGQR